jgi:hypothetical protein
VDDEEARVVVEARVAMVFLLSGGWRDGLREEVGQQDLCGEHE